MNEHCNTPNLVRVFRYGSHIWREDELVGLFRKMVEVNKCHYINLKSFSYSQYKPKDWTNTWAVVSDMSAALTFSSSAVLISSTFFLATWTSLLLGLRVERTPPAPEVFQWTQSNNLILYGKIAIWSKCKAISASTKTERKRKPGVERSKYKITSKNRGRPQLVII